MTKGGTPDDVFNAIISLANDERKGCSLLSDLVTCFKWSPLFMCGYDEMWNWLRISDATLGPSPD